ncbi:6866_t:CDS:2, partial [Racocetra persica]
YPIPNGYIVRVEVYGVDLIAKTQYNSCEKLIYTITWNSYDRKQQSISSNKSAKCLKRCRNQDQTFFKTQSRKKLFHELQSESQKNKHLKTLAYNIRDRIKSAVQLHNFHNTVLKSIKLNINDLYVNFQNLNSENSQSDQFLDSIACACDKSLISCDAYRQLVAIMPEIVCEYKIEKCRQEITRIMNQMIPIHMIQVNFVTSNRAYRLLMNILFVIISKLTDEKPAVLQVGDVIHIKLSGDKQQAKKHHNQ